MRLGTSLSILGLIITLAALTTGCATPATKTLQAPTPTLQSELPAFTDWRVAYIGQDQRLHAVSLVGKADAAGATAPVLGTYATGVWAAGTSMDGKHLAYFGSAHLTVLDTASGVRTTLFPMHVGDSAIFWSPDQRYIALDDTGYVMCVNVADGSTIIAPPLQNGALTRNQIVSLPFGWLDATHVAVQDWPAGSASETSFQSLDVTTGQLRPIATIPTNEHSAWFSVEPGGEFTLVSNDQIRSDPFLPIVDLINHATGAVRPLPQLTSLLPAFGGFTQELWRPGSSQTIVATGFAENGDLKYYLVDVSKDTAVQLTLSGFPEAWSPDGGTLVVATSSQQNMANGVGFKDVGVVGSDPFTLTALTMDSQGQVQNRATLTAVATTIPVLGFVRTA